MTEKETFNLIAGNVAVSEALLNTCKALNELTTNLNERVIQLELHVSNVEAQLHDLQGDFKTHVTSK